MKINSLIIALLLTTTFLSNSVICVSTTINYEQQTYCQPLIVETIYGNFEVIEPVLIELFNSPAMERIKHVLQYGVSDYVIKQNKKYTRYEHCVGVWALLRIYGATLEEQIAGLLHDASHTVFSHVGDVLFNHKSPHSSYQDDIHEWYLKQHNIDGLLNKYNVSLNAVLHKNGTHKMLEQNLPDICADRLEYNLQAGIKTGMLTIDDIATILQDVHYDNCCWYFTSIESAKKLGLVSLFNTEFVWGGPEDHFIYRWTADALKQALTIGLLTTDDIHFSTDAIVWSELWTSNDPIIIDCLDKITHYKKIVVTTTPENEHVLIKSKFRGLNPLIKTDETFSRLTDLDEDYKKEYERVKKQVTDGWSIQLNF